MKKIANVWKTDNSFNKPTNHYNLDIILAVWYRVKSKQGTQFRIYEHKNWIIEGFTKKYFCNKLVFFEEFNCINDAIECEKKLKNWRREWKVNLIEKDNVNWEDLSFEE